MDKISVGKYNIVSDRNGGQTTLSRRIVESILHIELPDHIVVHHMDMNRSNNDINNLMLMYREEHSRFHSKEAKYVKCICHNCNKIFELRSSTYNIRIKKSPRLYCSRRCVNIANPPPLNHKKYPDIMNELIIIDWNNGLSASKISEKYHWPESAVEYRIGILKQNHEITNRTSLTTKINNNDVITIYKSNESVKYLANKYGVCTETIRSIKQKRSRKEITESL